MMRQLLSALIVAALLTGPALNANAGGGGPTLEEQVAKLAFAHSELAAKVDKLEGQLKNANSRIKNLEGELKLAKELVASIPWLIEKTMVSAPLVSYIYEWVVPLVDAIQWVPGMGPDVASGYVQINSGLHVSGKTWLEGVQVIGELGWIEWIDGIIPMYHDLAVWLPYVFDQTLVTENLAEWATPLMDVLNWIEPEDPSLPGHLQVDSLLQLNGLVSATQTFILYADLIVNNIFLKGQIVPTGGGSSGGGGGGGSAPKP